MKNIDFLPSRYHERDARRKITIWRCVMLLAFGGFLCAATIGQWALKQSVQTTLDEYQATYSEAKLKTERVAALQKELATLTERAELYTYLRHPWPRSQLLIAVTQHLPDTVVLHEMNFSIDSTEDSSKPFDGTTTLAKAGTDNASHAKKDLEQLRKENDKTKTVVQLNGTTRDTGELNRYVSSLGQAPLFQSASLSSLGPIRDDAPSGHSKFQVEIVVRPGYGQPGGPTEPLAPLDAIAENTTGGRP